MDEESLQHMNRVRGAQARLFLSLLYEDPNTQNNFATETRREPSLALTYARRLHHQSRIGEAITVLDNCLNDFSSRFDEYPMPMARADKLMDCLLYREELRKEKSENENENERKQSENTESIMSQTEDVQPKRKMLRMEAAKQPNGTRSDGSDQISQDQLLNGDPIGSQSSTPTESS